MKPSGKLKLSGEGEGEEMDRGLAAALEAGNDDLVMEILVEMHGDHVYGYCRRMLGSHADIDDVSQTVFVQAFQCLKDLPRIRSARAWLLGIARHRCLDRLKAIRRGPMVLDDRDLRMVADQRPAAPLAGGDPRVSKALDDCLDHLDARSRAVLVMRFHDELSYDEISKLNVDTPGALRVRLARTLSALRRCLERKGMHP
jgi:RNA polymerase sigma-70 factor (ECF subfamily)